jgi:hypothetical protein
MSDGLRDRLNETRKSEEWATTWKPDRGEMLVGTFEKMDTGSTKYGESRVAHIRDEDGKLWGVWLFHSVLQDQWEQAEPTPGDRVGILYLGKRAGSDYDYHHYDVEVERRDEEPEPAVERVPSPGGEESTLEDPNGELPY